VTCRLADNCEGVLRRYGLTTLSDADVPISKGQSTFVQFSMYGNPEMAPLIEGLENGMRLEMMEGNHVKGRGKIEFIEQLSLD
jgi:hypothetical protein